MTDRLFPPDYADPVDTTTQVARMPGTVDAPCLCDRRSAAGIASTGPCIWPFCPPDWTHIDKEETE